MVTGRKPFFFDKGDDLLLVLGSQGVEVERKLHRRILRAFVGMNRPVDFVAHLLPAPGVLPAELQEVDQSAESGTGLADLPGHEGQQRLEL